MQTRFAEADFLSFVRFLSASHHGVVSPPGTRGGFSEGMDLIIVIGVVDPVEKPRPSRSAGSQGCAALVDRER